MKYSSLISKTLRDDPKEAEFISHKLLLKAGFINQLSSGVYTYMPLGLRVLNNVQDIIRKHLERVDCLEMLMPALAPKSLWERSGRSEIDVLMNVKDKHGSDFVLSPTHEETVTDIARQYINSHNDLPLSVFQIQNKFRDETRLKGGLSRGKEFIMKDAYSFHSTQESLDEYFDKFRNAYHDIFNELGLDVMDVAADSGSIGGSGSREFMASLAVGEDTIMVCDSCSAKSNLETARANISPLDLSESGDKQLMDTPNSDSIATLCKTLSVDSNMTIKSVVYKADDSYVLALIRGDLDVNETKLLNESGASEIFAASDDELNNLSLVKGSISPIIPEEAKKYNIKVIADLSIENSVSMIAGANIKDKHFTSVNDKRDWTADSYSDISEAKVGDTCFDCKNGVLSEANGMELGHIFKLGTKYSHMLNASFTSKDNKKEDVIMGCYGIGVSRIVSALVEAHHDDLGIVWPKSVAPFDISLISIGKSDELKEAAQKLYDDIRSRGKSVLFDDRSERPGIKFNDADLMGIPTRIVISERLMESGELEIKHRLEPDAIKKPINQVLDSI